MNKLMELGRAFFPSLLKDPEYRDVLRKRRIERYLRQQGYSRKEAKLILSSSRRA